MCWAHLITVQLNLKKKYCGGQRKPCLWAEIGQRASSFQQLEYYLEEKALHLESLEVLELPPTSSLSPDKYLIFSYLIYTLG